MSSNKGDTRASTLKGDAWAPSLCDRGLALIRHVHNVVIPPSLIQTELYNARIRQWRIMSTKSNSVSRSPIPQRR